MPIVLGEGKAVEQGGEEQKSNKTESKNQSGIRLAEGGEPNSQKNTKKN